MQKGFFYLKYQFLANGEISVYEIQTRHGKAAIGLIVHNDMEPNRTLLQHFPFPAIIRPNDESYLASYL